LSEKEIIFCEKRNKWNEPHGYAASIVLRARAGARDAISLPPKRKLSAPLGRQRLILPA
jgi:hypothetical protein